MHEMALCLSLVDLVNAQRAKKAFTRVKRVVVEVGILSHVDPDALAFSYEAASRGTVAEGSTLDIVDVPGAAWCMDCSRSVVIERRGEACTECGSYKLIVEQGDDLRLKELEVL